MLDVEERRKLGGGRRGNINNQSALEARQFPNYLTLPMSKVRNTARMPLPFALCVLNRQLYVYMLKIMAHKVQ